MVIFEIAVSHSPRICFLYTHVCRFFDHLKHQLVGASNVRIVMLVENPLEDMTGDKITCTQAS